MVVQLDKMLPEYYEVRGWDPIRSIPTREKLLELGLDDIAEGIQAP
jgi:aldehyde:ferredoxin oxidoreductase